jgi:hypothetical protein
MQVSQSDKLEDGRGFHSIGRIKASSEWRYDLRGTLNAVGAPSTPSACALSGS